ncbi:hypothetical protein BJ165DRAFT_1458390 [Panaeolus papilionaceus]|nr:hypothetical protein BJ165DRAFT_1458390 [Panaeolus papilionaceus]
MSGYDFSKLQYVDDRSPLIQYQGSWESLASTNGSYNSTVSSTTEIGASASFWFRGSYVFIAITLPACGTGQNDRGTRFRYYLSGIDDGGEGTACSSSGVMEGVDTYRMPVTGDPNVLHEVRVTNRGSQHPLVFDRFAFLPLEGSTDPSRTFPPSTTTTFTSRTITTSTSSPFITTGTPPSGTGVASSIETSLSPTVGSDADPSQSSASNLSRVIIGSCISLVVLLLLGASMICCLRRRARSRISKTQREKPSDPFDDAYAQPVAYNHSPSHIVSGTMTTPFFHHRASSSSSIQLVPYPQSNSASRTAAPPPQRPRSPNSLFDVSRSSTPSRNCILGQKSEFSRCFCPSCDDRNSSTPRRKHRASSALRSIVPSIASSNATAAPAYARYRASIDVRSVQSNPFSEVLPAYDALQSIDETSSLTSPTPRTSITRHPSWHDSQPSSKHSSSAHSFATSSIFESASNPSSSTSVS